MATWSFMPVVLTYVVADNFVYTRNSILMLVFIYPINAVQIAVDIHVGEQNARPTMSVISSHCSIGDLSIKEHGGPRYLRLIFF
jgi:hypothetical protein